MEHWKSLSAASAAFRGTDALALDRRISPLHVDSAGETLLDDISSLTGVLWNMAADNGLVQNGYIGLISCVTAGASICLSLWCCLYSFKKLDRDFPRPADLEIQRQEIQKETGNFQYLIAAPILVGIVCALGSVLGAAYLFGNSGDAESPNDRAAERNDFIVGQVFPAAVNFIFVARYMAQLSHLLFRWGKQETDILLMCRPPAASSEMVGINPRSTVGKSPASGEQYARIEQKSQRF